MTRSPAFFAGRPLWARVLLACTAGAAGALAHDPFNFSIAILIPLFAAFSLLRIARSVMGAGVIGLAIGTAYFAATLNWITEPVMGDAATTGWMAPCARLLLSIGLGLFWGAALALARWAGPSAWVLVVTLTGAEMLRAYLFTGFPWATPPQALVGGFAGQV